MKSVAALDRAGAGGLKIGHGGIGADGEPDELCVPPGPSSELDVQAGTLTVGPCVR